MSDWEENKQNFIDKLGNADRIFDEIFKVDSEELVIQGEEREELKNLQTANKKSSTSSKIASLLLRLSAWKKQVKVRWAMR